MKLIFRIILIAASTYFLSALGPWWLPMILTSVICALIYSNGLSAFIAGFVGVGAVWFTYSYFLDLQSNSFLTNKVVELFPFDDKTLMLILSGVIGGVAGGLAGITGNSFRLLFVKKKKPSIYS